MLQFFSQETRLIISSWRLVKLFTSSLGKRVQTPSHCMTHYTDNQVKDADSNNLLSVPREYISIAYPICHTRMVVYDTA